ncbi:MAG: DUF4097 family beta strand repeat-containing protein, partial [Clostridium sp.]|nr:DUF4097 family beta strand repeat-containing protein [Clostridium sp.]
MKFKSFLTKNKGLTSILVISTLCIGIAGMVYGTNKDQAIQERKTKEIELPKESYMSVGTTSQSYGASANTRQMATPSLATSNKVTLEGSEPETKPQVSMKEAAALGRATIEKNEGIALADTEIVMNYMKSVGTTESGSWRGTIEKNGTDHYEFKVDASSSQVSEVKHYTKEKTEQAWKRTNEVGQAEQMIRESSLAPFHKINVDLCSGKACHIIGEKDYQLVMKQIGDDYTINYEIKDDTLYIKEKSLKSSNDLWPLQGGWKNIDNRVLIVIPSNVKMDDIEVSTQVGELELDSLKAENIKLENQSGNIDIDTSEISKLNLSLQAGNAGLEDSKVQKGLIEVQSGNANIRNVETNELEIDAQAGNISIGKGMKGKVIA